MMRSLWTAASGMIAQQTNMDTISNNLANINTTGYKKEVVEFKALMYQTVQEKATASDGTTVKPVGVQIGLGVRSGAITTNFVQGQLLASSGTYDYAIQGNGFFTVQLPNGSYGYTRNGDFNFSVGTDGMTLTTTAGYPVLDVNGDPIVLPDGIKPSDISVDKYGNLMAPDANNNAQKIGIQMGLTMFNNPAGLEKTSDTILKESAASGAPTLANAETIGSEVVSNYLEGSNVQAVDEMVNMIIAQRAYEMNSKAITASDQMLQQANNLRS